jgi:hypothetical protein
VYTILAPSSLAWQGNVDGEIASYKLTTPSEAPHARQPAERVLEDALDTLPISIRVGKMRRIDADCIMGYDSSSYQQYVEGSQPLCRKELYGKDNGSGAC